MAGAITAGVGARPSNTIAITAAAIGGVSALLSGTLGFQHARSAYEAATGGTAGLDDYVTVGRAFWDVVPIGFAVAVAAGLLTAGVQLSAAFWRFGFAFVGVVGVAIGASVDPARHMVGYLQVTTQTRDTPSFLQACVDVYGSAACMLAAIAGAGIGVAVVQATRDMR